MNGRVYDPTLGRFLTPDPLVQRPTLSQNWNRYTYAWNNPLRYTDPTGYSNTSSQYAIDVQRNGKQADVDVVDDGPNGSTTVTKGGADTRTVQRKGSELKGASYNAVEEEEVIVTSDGKDDQQRLRDSMDRELEQIRSEREAKGGGCRIPMKCAGDNSSTNYYEHPDYVKNVEFARSFTSTSFGVIGDILAQPMKGISLGLPMSFAIEVGSQAMGAPKNPANVFGLFVGGTAATVSTIFSANPLVGVGVGHSVSTGASKAYDNVLTPTRTEDFFKNYTPPKYGD